jgi:hypothetical protein
VESLCKGLSGMDAARAPMGQGWPFGARPWNDDGTKEPRRRRGRMSGVLSLWLLSLCTSKEKVTRREGEKHGRSLIRSGVIRRCRIAGRE